MYNGPMQKLEHSSRSAQIVAIQLDHVGQRVDNFLMGSLKGVPRSHIYKILRTGQVRVNSRRVTADYKLVSGDLLRVPPVRVVQTTTAMPASDLTWMNDRILYEDESLLIFNKP